MRKFLEILAFILIGASLAIIAASCNTMRTGRDLQAFYGAPRVTRSYANGKGQYWHFVTSDQSTRDYWLVNDTIRAYNFH